MPDTATETPELDLWEFRQNVLRTQSKRHLMMASASLDSVIERMDFCGYYHATAKKLHDLVLERAHPVRMRHDGEIQGWRFEARANISALMQSWHCIPDTLSQVIYWSLGLRHRKPESIRLGSVRGWLDEHPDCRRLKGTLDDWVSHEDYRYLHHLVNYSKHRSILSSDIQYEMLRGDEPTLVFRAFSYNQSKSYPSRPVYDFISAEFGRHEAAILAILEELQQVLASRPSRPGYMKQMVKGS